ncbi:hypothetical protein [Microbacterium gorillae]|uniref:hypothetical protein n=1 Tax=Microbacterium gorillae TaxID=1231063 RepID=UPI003D99BF7C
MASVPVSVPVPGQSPIALQRRIDGWMNATRSAGTYRRRGDRIRVLRRMLGAGVYQLPSGVVLELRMLEAEDGTVLTGRARTRVMDTILLLTFGVVAGGIFLLPLLGVVTGQLPSVADIAWATVGLVIFGGITVGIMIADGRRLRRTVPEMTESLLADLG